MITFEDQGLATNEAVKGFEKSDDLAKAYIDLHGKVASGDISLLPEEFRKDSSIAPFKTMSDVAKGYIETKKLVGGIKRPPADVTGYKFSNVDGLDASVKPDAGFQKVIADEALKAGIPAESADFAHKVAMGYLNQRVMAQKKAQDEKFQANSTALKQKWGADYENKIKNIERTFVKLGGQDGLSAVGGSLANAPVALEMFDKLVSLLSEDSINNLGGHEGSSGASDAEEKEYQEYRNALVNRDDKHPFYNEKLADHLKAVKRYSELSVKHFSKPA